ncbi:MAG: hypothetical protein ABIR54_22320 [Burkholderiaceae bacterium]
MCDGFSEAGEGAAIGGMASASAAAAAASAAAAGGVAVGTAGGVGTAAGAAALTAGGVATANAAAGGILGTGITTAQLLSGLQIASAVAGLGMGIQTKVAGDASNKALTKNALTARAENANQVGLEEIQQHDAASQKIGANNQAAREAGATYLSQGGVGGLSVDAMLGDIAGKGAKYNSSVLSNLSSANAALDNQMRNVNTNAANVIAGEKTPATPDYLGTALQIGGDYGNYLKNNG